MLAARIPLFISRSHQNADFKSTLRTSRPPVYSERLSQLTDRSIHSRLSGQTRTSNCWCGLHITYSMAATPPVNCSLYENTIFALLLLHSHYSPFNTFTSTLHFGHLVVFTMFESLILQSLDHFSLSFGVSSKQAFDRIGAKLYNLLLS